MFWIFDAYEDRESIHTRKSDSYVLKKSNLRLRGSCYRPTCICFMPAIRSRPTGWRDGMLFSWGANWKPLTTPHTFCLYEHQQQQQHGINWRLSKDKRGKVGLHRKEQEALLSQRPRDALCRWIFRQVTEGQSRSFEMTQSLWVFLCNYIFIFIHRKR